MPLCRLQGFFPFVAGRWHGVPYRVVAKHLIAAIASEMLFLGLGFDVVGETPCVIDLFGDDGLPAKIVDVDVAHDLHTAILQLAERLGLPRVDVEQFGREVAKHLRLLNPLG